MSIEEMIRQAVKKEVEPLIAEIQRLKRSSEGEPRMLTPHEAAEFIGVGRNKIYTMLNDKERYGLPSIKEGKKHLIPYHALLTWIDKQAI